MDTVLCLGPPSPMLPSWQLTLKPCVTMFEHKYKLNKIWSTVKSNYMLKNFVGIRAIYYLPPNSVLFVTTTHIMDPNIAINIYKLLNMKDVQPLTFKNGIDTPYKMSPYFEGRRPDWIQHRLFDRIDILKTIVEDYNTPLPVYVENDLSSVSCMDYGNSFVVTHAECVTLLKLAECRDIVYELPTMRKVQNPEHISCPIEFRANNDIIKENQAIFDLAKMVYALKDSYEYVTFGGIKYGNPNLMP